MFRCGNTAKVQSLRSVKGESITGSLSHRVQRVCDLNHTLIDFTPDTLLRGMGNLYAAARVRCRRPERCSGSIQWPLSA